MSYYYVSMKKDILNNLVKDGKSTRQIAEKLNCSQTNVRHWLRKFDLQTGYKSKIRKGAKKIIKSVCNKHGETDFILRTEGYYRCKKCRSEAVIKRRRVIKEKAVDYKGGKCEKCGYDKCIAALEFHHLDPEQKDFSISMQGVSRAWEKVKKELDKCILVCSNCHREIHHVSYKLDPPKKKKELKSHIDRKKFHTTKEELHDLIVIQKIPFTTIGKQFGVSDNAIRKRAKVLGIEWYGRQDSNLRPSG